MTENSIFTKLRILSAPIYCKDSNITPGGYTKISSDFEGAFEEGYIRIYFENYIFIRKHFLPM